MIYKNLRKEDHPDFTKNICFIIGISVILLLSCIVYSPITKLNFSSPDDGWMLLKYADVHPEKFSFSYLYRIFTSFNDIQYSPFNTLYYYLIYQINGYDSYYYHLFSFILHLLNTIVIYKLVIAILKAFAIENALRIAYLVSLLWCIHPLNVEPVVWISASKVLLFSFFSLLSLLYFIKSFQSRKRKYYIYSTILFLISCFCKEQSIVTPLMFLLFVICNKRKEKSQIYNKKEWVVYVGIAFIISVIFGFISLKANSLGTSEITPIIRYPFWQRIVLSFYCISFYLTNQIVPINLHYNYPFPVNPDEWMPLSFYIYPIVFLIFCIVLTRVIKQSKNSLFYFMCICFFFIQLGLVLQIIPMTRPAIMADRYMYIPSFVLLMILATIGVKEFYKKKKNKNKYLIVLAIYIFYFTIYSHNLVCNWIHLNLIK